MDTLDMAMISSGAQTPVYVSPARQAELAGTAPWLLPGSTPAQAAQPTSGGFKFPWQTPTGEGFQAPWTQAPYGDNASARLAGATPAAGGGILAGVVSAEGLIALGVPAVVAAGLAVALARTKMPWETATGEGMIAPWSQMEQNQAGEWIQSGSALNGGGTMAAVATGIPGLTVVKAWTNASKDGRLPASVEFLKMSNGMIYTRNISTGEVKRYRPRKHIVISQDPRLSTLKKLDRVQSKVTKLVRKYAPKLKASRQVPSPYLSAVERKAIKA